MLEKWKLLGLIINNKSFSESDIKVAYALLDHFNYKTRQLYPTNRRLVEQTKLSLRQVQLSTAKLHKHKLVYKLLLKGKNHYKLTMEEYQNYEQSFASKTNTTNKPSPPTKPTINIYNIKDSIKRIAKRSNPYYKATISNGLTYHENMENKLVKQMRVRLSIDVFNHWYDLYADNTTKGEALSYARRLCG